VKEERTSNVREEQFVNDHNAGEAFRFKLAGRDEALLDNDDQGQRKAPGGDRIDPV
jgi:hypothetical protein